MITRRNKFTNRAYTPAVTTTVTPEAKSIASVANGLAERRAKKKSRGYTKELSQATTDGGVVAKSGAAMSSIVDDIADQYVEATSRQAKMQALDIMLAEVASKLPLSSVGSFFAKVPLISAFIEGRQKAVAKTAFVTFGPAIAVYVADRTTNEKVASGLYSLSDTIVEIGARDGIKGGIDLLSPKMKALWETFTA